ncbi:hypothetical protein CRG98_021386 [Punica granatum]|uniref:Uncharacterized protein n=1 Tax=Punica granatum TaxID=22663 RepID=A0A2I0JPK1_PUNGR|nr:hypothetical protein CRG98_021386 [Punica granatum]
MQVVGKERCAGSHLPENSYRVFLPIIQRGRARQEGIPYEAEGGSVRTSHIPSAQPSESTNKHAHRLREHTSLVYTQRWSRKIRPSHTAWTRDPQGKWPTYLLQHDPRSALQHKSTVRSGLFLRHNGQPSTSPKQFRTAYTTAGRKRGPPYGTLTRRGPKPMGTSNNRYAHAWPIGALEASHPGLQK